MSICEECPKKELCSDLCPEAEAYIRQDEIKQTHILINEIRYGKWMDFLRPRCHFNGKEAEICKMLLMGKGIEQICKDLDITKNYFYQIVYRIKKKL